MGTNIYIELWSDSAQQSEDAVQIIMDKIQRINQLISQSINKPLVESA
jgi:thiamine biosynthesis lipoprotein